MMRTRSVGRRGFSPIVALAAGIATATSACSFQFDPSTIPVPGRAVTGSGYPLHIEFENVLNLPAGAKVVVNGAPAGRLEKVTLLPDKAIANVTILDGLSVPRTANVSLTQDTILGDIYISIDTKSEASPEAFRADDTVPLRQTKSAAAVEDVLIDLAAFLGGGSLMDLQSTFATIVTKLPTDPAELQRSVSAITRTVNDLAANNGSVDSLIGDLAAITSTAVSHQKTVGSLLGDRDRTFLGSNLTVMAYTAKIYTELGQLLASFKNSAPALDSATGLLNGVINPLLYPGGSSGGRASNLENLERLLREKVVPFLRSGARVNVVPQQQTTNDSATAQQVVRNLRMIGVIQ